jgi:hypothetical protein
MHEASPLGRVAACNESHAIETGCLLQAKRKWLVQLNIPDMYVHRWLPGFHDFYCSKRAGVRTATINACNGK